MSKFKVGDYVEILHTDFPKLQPVGTIAEVIGVGKNWVDVGCLQSTHGFLTYLFCEVRLAEPQWQPEVGEIIEVSDEDDFCDTKRVRFVALDAYNGGDAWYVCAAMTDEGSFDGRYEEFEYARPLKKTHTITLEDGTPVELSEESYKALKDSIS